MSIVFGVMGFLGFLVCCNYLFDIIDFDSDEIDAETLDRAERIVEDRLKPRVHLTEFEAAVWKKNDLLQNKDTDNDSSN